MVKWALLGSFHLEILPQRVELDLGFLGRVEDPPPATTWGANTRAAFAVSVAVTFVATNRGLVVS